MKKELRMKVWRKYGNRCAYCGEFIFYKDMQVDHKFPQSLKHIIDHPMAKLNEETNINHIDDFENLMPSCRKCNNFKGAMRLELFRRELERQIDRLGKNAQFNRALKYKQLIVTKKPIVFYFELIEREVKDQIKLF